MPPFIGKIVNLGFIKNQMAKVTTHQATLTQAKHDVEVYLGFYLIVMALLGGGNLLAVMLYWQLMRVRYMVSYGCQGGWKRMDEKIKKNVLDSPRCPGMVRTGYQKVKGLLASMIPDP